MKHCFKNYLKLGVLLFGIFCFVMSCQKEDDEAITETSDKIQDILSRTLNLEDIPHFNSVSQKLNKINRSLNSKDSSLFRTLNTDSTTIITDNIIYMTYEDSHTYTFKLFRSSPEYYIENLVLHFNTVTNEYDEYLLQYDITEQEFIEIANGSSINENTNIIMTELEDGTLTNLLNRTYCSTSCQTIYVQCTAGGDHWPGENCTGNVNQQAYSYQECTITCPEDPVETIDAGDSPGGGGKLATNPNITEPCIMANGQVGILAPNGDCVKKKEFEDPHIRNCEELKKLKTNEEVYNSFNVLKSKVNENREYGFGFSIGVSPEELPLADGDPDHLRIPSGGLIYGFSHLHPEETAANQKMIPMFSVEDIYKLGEIAALHNVQGTSNDFYSLFFATLTIKHPNGPETYALKINDWTEFTSFVNDFYGKTDAERETYANILARRYTDIYETQGGFISSNYLKTMFKFINERQIKGVSVYKAIDENLSNWTRLDYNTITNDIDETNCN